MGRTADMVNRQRTVKGIYISCTGCNTEMEIEKPVTVNVPYCGSCGKIVLDVTQKYCCWCGCKFDGQD